MDKTFLEMAMEMVKAQAGVRAMTTEEIVSMTQILANKLAGLSCGCAAEAPQEETAGAPIMDPKKSIKEKSVTCLECGKVMKLLTAKHLASHGLTKKEYLAKHGLKKGTSLMAKGLSRARRETMQNMKLWERKGAGKNAAVAEAKPAAAPKKITAKKAAPAAGE